MCGIFGIVRFDGKPVATGPIEVMRDSMRHRGPDDYGQFIAGPVGIANLRLSIIDLNTGHQPIFNEDRRVAIVYNGEVYNFKQLRSQLTGHVFTTQTDTESILHAYEEWGLDCLSRLNGMFAVALWDGRQQEVLLARDRVGIKPLYYVQTADYLAFSSEIKGLWRAGLVDEEIDHQALGEYLNFKYVSDDRTVFRSVRRLRPGEWLRVGISGRVQRGRFWDFRLQPEGVRSEADCASQLQELVRESVKDQMVADVPVGSFLSGGLDSGIVVTEMARLTEERVRAFTIEYDWARGPQNESALARETAAFAGADHTMVSCDSRQVLDMLPLLVYHLDEPIAEPLLAPSFLLSKAARREVKVVLTGEGADELFAGYTRYKLGHYTRLLRWVPAAVRRAACRLAERLLGPLDMRCRILRASVDQRAVYDWNMQFRPDEVQALTGIDCDQENPHRQMLESAGPRSLLDILLEEDSRLRLPEFILTRADKMTMANSLEMRPPLLDNRVVDFASRLPNDLKLHGTMEKYVLRRAFADRVPSGLATRRKVAFSAPYETWLAELQGRYLADSACVRAGLLRPRELDRLCSGDAFYRGRRSEKIWSVIVLEIWFRIFVEKSLDPTSPG